MMHRLLIAATLVFAFANANAVRVLDPVESAVEVSLANLTLPTNTVGSVTLRACTDCPYSNHRLADGAQWLVNGKAVTIQEALEHVALTRQNRAAAENTLVTVFLDVNTKRVTRVAIIRRAA